MAHKISDTGFFKRRAEAAAASKGEAAFLDGQIPGQTENLEQVRTEPLRIRKVVETALADSGEALKGAGFQSMAVELEKIRQNAGRERFAIAVVGEFSRGKSTFINNLIGKDFLPAGDLPTTAVLTKIRYNDREVIMAFDQDNKKVLERELSQKSWDGLTAQNFGGEDFQGNVLVGVKSEWLRDMNVEMIDTPGAGDLSEARAKVVGDALLGCDGAIIAVSAAAALSQSEKLFIEERLTARKMPFLLMIVTKLDLVPADERVQVIRYIENKLKKWGMDIPVYIPYPIELGEDTCQNITGMDKVTDEIRRWVSSAERRKLVETWILGKALDIMKNAASSMTEKLILLEESDEKKREELISEKKEKLTQARLAWGDMQLQMQYRCTDCYRLLLTKIDDHAANITERLQYEVSHADDPQKWWEKDFPYRIKEELTNMAVGVEDVISGRIEKDVRWYCAAIEESFQIHILYQKKAIADKQIFGDFDVGGEIKFENLEKQRTAVKIGTAVLSISGAALLSSLGFMPIIATMGIGTGTAIFSERFFCKKLEEQRSVLKDEIARCVPAYIKQAMGDSEKRLEAIYKNIIGEAYRSEQAWLEAQQTAMDNIGDSEGDRSVTKLEEHRKLIDEQISSIQALLQIT